MYIAIIVAKPHATQLYNGYRSSDSHKTIGTKAHLPDKDRERFRQRLSVMSTNKDQVVWLYALHLPPVLALVGSNSSGNDDSGNNERSGMASAVVVCTSGCYVTLTSRTV
jgi:hypothetical protein